MKWNVEKKFIVGGLCAALLMMVGINWISYQNAIQLIKSSERVKRTYTILEYLAEIQATLNEAESGRRGYLLFGTQVELDRYDLAIAKSFKLLDTLERSLNYKDSPIDNLKQLRSLIDKRQQIFQESNILFRLNPNDLSVSHPMVIASNQNRSDLKQIFINIQREEQRSLEIGIERSNSDMHYRMVIENIGTLLSLTIFLIVYLVLYKQFLKRQEAERIQQKLLQEKELSELKLEFLALVSHEFRTPLSVILGSSQLLKDELSSQIGQSRLRSLNRIESSAKSMKQMLTDVLAIARADAEKLEYQPKWLEIQSFCLNLVEDIQIGDLHHHVINFTDIGDRTHAWLDESLIYSMLSNLLSNAIKYSHEGCHIEFILDGQIDCITFKVKDQGIGITPEVQSTLFEPFHRGNNVGSISGTGLGLALVKRCLDLHQGQIIVESKVDLGTTFIVQIPQNIPNSSIPMHPINIRSEIRSNEFK